MANTHTQRMRAGRGRGKASPASRQCLGKDYGGHLYAWLESRWKADGREGAAGAEAEAGARAKAEAEAGANRRDIAQMGPAPVRWPVIYA